jgi:hypothetical protein
VSRGRIARELAVAHYGQLAEPRQAGSDRNYQALRMRAGSWSLGDA